MLRPRSRLHLRERHRGCLHAIELIGSYWLPRPVDLVLAWLVLVFIVCDVFVILSTPEIGTELVKVIDRLDHLCNFLLRRALCQRIHTLLLLYLVVHIIVNSFIKFFYQCNKLRV